MKIRVVLVGVVLQLLAVLLVLVPSANAQEVIESYTLQSFNVGATTPVQSNVIQATAVTCNLVPPSTPSTTINPTMVLWDDPNNIGRVCRYTIEQTAGAPIFSLPAGNYEGVVLATNTAGTSPPSNRAPFSKQTTPAARTGLRFTK